MMNRVDTPPQSVNDDVTALQLQLAALQSELQTAHENLANQAHEAGIAEMAVGVLHNIGNAITPSKVATSILLKNLQQSPIRNHLSNAMVPLQAALEKAALDSAEKARLMAIIKLLPESIKEEYDNTIAEIKKIRDKQNHVESMISLQMKYSYLSGSHKSVNLNRLVDDALKMMDESLQKRDIDIEKHYGQVPDVYIEESKLLQVLINLIKNGYEAMDQADLRKMTFQTFVDNGFACLKTSDTGIGFDAAQKEKMFHFGYTTKQNGSGFGLHSSYNYLVNAHQGKLTAHSDGNGKGAEFTLYLPISKD